MTAWDQVKFYIMVALVLLLLVVNFWLPSSQLLLTTKMPGQNEMQTRRDVSSHRTIPSQILLENLHTNLLSERITVHLLMLNRLSLESNAQTKG